MTKQAWIDTLINYEIKNQWSIYDEKSVFIRRDVIFNEAKMTYKNVRALFARYVVYDIVQLTILRWIEID
jgi:hypothetical protein